MVRTVVVCLVGVAMSVVLGCKSEPSKLGAQVGAAAEATLGGSGRFHYQVVDGVPVVLWTAPDGKHVTAMRVDARWACDISSGKLVCGQKEEATPTCEFCPNPSKETCPCTNPVCSPGCLANTHPFAGLTETAPPSR